MLRLTFLIIVLLITAGIISVLQSKSNLTRLTNTPEHTINLNPTLSDDGRVVVFESSADLVSGGGSSSFHAFRAELDGAAIVEIGRTRAVSPALSRDGKIMVLASTEDLVGRNTDRNSEIFEFHGSSFRQLTETEPDANTLRLSDGNFQPSVTGDGRTIAFSSNRDFTGENSDLSVEIFLYHTLTQTYVQLTNETDQHIAVSPKISADGSRVYYRRTAVDDLTASDLIMIETKTLNTRVLATDISELSLTEGRALSNDGMRLVYSAEVATNQSQVFLFDLRENSIRQLTQLPSRSVDVRLQPTISGDGKRVAFATRRRVVSTSDGGVELYLLDLPTGQVQQITNAPAAATAEVVSSLNFDGSLVAFNFARVLSGPVAEEDFRNNSEIYVTSIAARPEFGAATVLNAASQGWEPQKNTQLAPGSIATIRGSALAFKTEAVTVVDPPLMVAGTNVKVNGQDARIFYVSPLEVVFAVPSGLLAGPAEFVVTNAEGFSSKAEAVISTTAPGVFTTEGDGRGEAIILNSDTLTTAPFDPSSGQLRLSIFATGTTHAKNVSVTIKGKPVTVETVLSSRLKGVDEIHLLIPSELGGAGTATLIVIADGVQSNSVTVELGGVAPTPSPSPSPSPVPTPESPSQIVISQVFGGGGNSGAPFRNDFIEIFNRGSVAVNLAGWSVQYASATASTWSVTPLTSVVLLPGQYYLVQQSSGGANGSPLPAPDASGTIAMAAGSGKVVLVTNSTALSGACPNTPNIVDMVGYGSTANCFRGSAPAPAASNTNALLRAASGCQDLRNNATDFGTGPPSPRNTNALTRICAD
ncbi:MAG TPA: lamin tail domain-containing protein [Pyrinomonadaceae bacterium]|nr:lamin tail domain-containing protein [Pyrinomonadaceae bacterium]